jgi:RimK family alpha-L-glutamate ligase
MRFAVVAHRTSETNDRLAAAALELGFDAAVLTPREALRLLEPGDLALGRLDVREKLDGIESGSAELERLTAEGVDVLNPPGTLISAHDKLLTARALRLAALPHPHTWLIAEGMPSPAPELPLVLKPRFGSWGRDVVLCRTQEDLDRELTRFALRSWFREYGALAQELVRPLGWDLRVVVAGGHVVGAARRVAAEGEWRTNVSLGGTSEPVSPTPLDCGLAIAAAAAVRGDLVGVDLLPTQSGYVVSEINGAVDFRPWYALDVENVYFDAVYELIRTVQARRVLAAV